MPRRVIILVAFIVLAACSAPSAQPLSRNALAMQSARAGTLGEPALVEFYAADCMTCNQIRGQVSALDQRYDGRVKFIYLDIELAEAQPYLAKYNVRGLPTFALLDRKGRIASSMSGWLGEPALTTALDKLIGQP
jgi:thioredoxin-like negative regulator of GroEL